MSKPTLNQIIKNRINQALIELMARYDFHAITITQITQTAGVSRVSFYRNFSSKEDILIKALRGDIEQHFYRTAQSGQLTNHRELFMAIFAFVEQKGDIVDLLYQNDLSHIFLAFIRECCGAKPESDNDTAYHHSLNMGVCFGALDEWIRRGRQGTAAEMADKVAQALATILAKW
ncbi:TetR/AcrR family transcriptional regulator [Testudinibacter sp. TR-2022]|uniref:TetR/AcrR family transcriptional regulator n=1 Tax=Testudinibacter sp. TR-2022 TaxID=2585029 RepID=UPI0022798DD1|nr:TetR/AcrR family transcriptional regulator [Testudinibacter sp. TR-2022]